MNTPRSLGALAALGLLATALLAGASGGSHVSASRHVGAESCARCHPEAYAVWKGSAHARALEALDARNREDPNCRQCHTADPEGLNPDLVGVQCETCHGPGRYYSPAHVMRDTELREALGFVKAGPETCARCHTDSTPSIAPFDYARKLELIRHASPAPAAP